MARRKTTTQTIKRLFALSGNKCAFPGCDRALITNKGDFVGQVCHIEAANERGQRYNPHQNDEDRRSFKNLLLFCYDHHKETDDTTQYTVQTLKKIKDDHEKRHRQVSFSMPDDLLTNIVKQVHDKIVVLSEDVASIKTIHAGNIRSLSQNSCDLLEQILESNESAKWHELKKREAHTDELRKRYEDLQIKALAKRNATITQLTELINEFPKQALSIPFLKTFTLEFVYNWNHNASLDLCKLMLPIAEEILRQQADSAEKQLYQLKIINNKLSVAWSTKVDLPTPSMIIQGIELSKDLSSLSTFNQKQLADLQHIRFSLTDKLCGYDDAYLEQFRDLTYTWSDPEERLPMIISALQCSACRALRRGDKHEADNWLAKADELRNQNGSLSWTTKSLKDYEGAYVEDTVGKNELLSMGYYFLLRGILSFQKGANHFKEATEQLLLADQWFKKLKKMDKNLLEFGYINYLLFKAAKEMDLPYAKYYKAAKSIFKEAPKKNFCSFDFDAVHKELFPDS